MRELFFLFAVFSVSQTLPELDDDFAYPYHRVSNTYRPRLRIIGGQDARPHEYPYQVGLYCYTASSTDFCGGSLISPNYVLTAAHCVDAAYKMEVVLGAHSVTDPGEESQIRLISTDFIVHERWDRNSRLNDIALVKLPSPVKETPAIRIIDVAAGYNKFAGYAAVVTGWGKTFQEQSFVTPVLKFVVSTVLTNDDCKKASPSYNAVMKPSLLCISGDDPVGSCRGDSGGPLVVNGLQVGVVSFGHKNCTAGMPSVFTRLTEFTEWISNNSDVTPLY